MRLIDADALEELFREVIGGIAKKPEMNGNLEHMVRASAMVIEMIQDAPTIEPERKKGKWIERNPQNSDKCRLIECDQCGFSHIVGFNVPYEHWIENRNFCERCGADMRGEQNG